MDIYKVLLMQIRGIELVLLVILPSGYWPGCAMLADSGLLMICLSFKRILQDRVQDKFTTFQGKGFVLETDKLCEYTDYAIITYTKSYNGNTLELEGNYMTLPVLHMLKRQPILTCVLC